MNGVFSSTPVVNAVNSACKAPYVFIWKRAYTFGYSPAEVPIGTGTIGPEGMSPYLKELEAALTEKEQLVPSLCCLSKSLGNIGGELSDDHAVTCLLLVPVHYGTLFPS